MKHPHLDNPVVNIPVLQVLDSAISGVAAEVSHPLSRLVNVITSILSGENSGNEEAVGMGTGPGPGARGGSQAGARRREGGRRG